MTAFLFMEYSIRILVVPTSMSFHKTRTVLDALNSQHVLQQLWSRIVDNLIISNITCNDTTNEEVEEIGLTLRHSSAARICRNGLFHCLS